MQFALVISVAAAPTLPRTAIISLFLLQCSHISQFGCHILKWTQPCSGMIDLSWTQIWFSERQPSWHTWLHFTLFTYRTVSSIWFIPLCSQRARHLQHTERMIKLIPPLKKKKELNVCYRTKSHGGPGGSRVVNKGLKIHSWQRFRVLRCDFKVVLP